LSVPTVVSHPPPLPPSPVYQSLPYNLQFFLAIHPTALDVVTPPLDGTILPGVTRASVLSLLSHHPLSAALPQLPSTLRLHPTERTLTMTELFTASASGTLREVFCVGTAAVVIPAARIGWQRSSSGGSSSSGNGGNGGSATERDVEVKVQAAEVEDIVLPVVGGEGSIAQALWERLVDIQEGRVEWEGWGVPCECEEASSLADNS
jgi:branched-chain amino acid aminotransferase